jgi:hypothetical protein
MLSYLYNTLENFTSNNNFLDLTSKTNTNEIDFVILSSHLMLQFGLLVFLLSFVALAAPNYFGLYGAFLLTLLPLVFA